MSSVQSTIQSRSTTPKNESQFVAEDDKKTETEAVSDYKYEQAEVSNNDAIHEDPNFNYASEDSKTLEDVLQETLPSMKLLFEKWGETFRECERFENLYPARLDEIIKEAKCLEEQLQLQKDAIKQRLKFLTRTLAPAHQQDD